MMVLTVRHSQRPGHIDRNCQAVAEPTARLQGNGGPSPGHIATAHSSTVNLCPASAVGGYKLSNRISGINLTLLLDTGAAVTLLRKEAWERILKNSPIKAPDLIPKQSLELVGADGSALKTHGTTLLTLQLNGSDILVDVATFLTTTCLAFPYKYTFKVAATFLEATKLSRV
jgi:hypothetical protein